jgi:thiol-disulfide isomerase/thioredoxin
MTLSRRQALYALAGVAALGAGVAANWQRLEVTALGDAGDDALADFWRREFDTPSGAKLATRSLRGRPLVINFWATWCPPCVKEMPELDRFSREAGPRGWQVLGVAIDQPEAVRQFLQTNPVSFPIAVAGSDGLSLVRELGNAAGGLPFSVMLSAAGRVIQRKLGGTEFNELNLWSQKS